MIYKKLEIKNLKFREQKITDLPLHTKIHHETLRQYVEPIWGWNETEQDKLIKDRYDPKNFRFIEKNGEIVGELSIEARELEYFLSNILILPDFQNQSIGSSLIKCLCETAKKQGKAVTLKVLKTNPAITLYQRLGFIEYKEDEFSFYMRWKLKQ